MKIIKIVGMLFLIIGLIFAILGVANYIIKYTEKDGRIYTTASIIEINERKTGDPEFPIEYTVYVNLDVDGKKTTAELNTYDSSFKEGKQIDIYYFENDIEMVYKEGSDSFYILFAFVGTIFAVVGAMLLSKKSKCHVVV